MESRAIYNEMLANLKVQCDTDGTVPTEYELTARFKGRGGEHVPATTMQTLADRLSKALKRYLQMKELDLPVGFPRFTTQKCSRCGQYVQKSLSVRTHHCPSCGLAEDRDVMPPRTSYG